MITVAAVILAVSALVFTLLVRASDLPPAEAVPPLKPDEERLGTLQESLQDLEFEHRLGKLSEADYQQARAEVERELEQLGARLAGAVSPPTAAATVCPHCGARFPTPLKFCGECGRPMRSVTA